MSTLNLENMASNTSEKLADEIVEFFAFLQYHEVLWATRYVFFCVLLMRVMTLDSSLEMRSPTTITI